MSATSINRTSNSWRIAALTVIIFLSLMLPIGIVYFSLVTAFSGKPLGRTSRESKTYHGAIKDGELWFPVITFSSHPSGLPVEWRICRLDLETGIERETGIVIKNDQCRPFLSDGKILARGSRCLYEIKDSRLTPLVEIPARPPRFSSSIFVYDNQITTIVPTDDGSFQLIHLINREWVNGRKILLPPLGSAWVDDLQGGTKIEAPPPTRKPGPVGNPLSVDVVQNAQGTHLFLIDYDRFAAYRQGFQFADEEPVATSALSPANAVTDDQKVEYSGWEPIQPRQQGDRTWASMGCDQYGVLFTSNSSENLGRIVRRLPDGHWEVVEGANELSTYRWRNFLTDSSNLQCYLFDQDNAFCSLRISRVDASVVQQSHIVLPGSELEYLNRWKYLLTGILAAWMIHLVLLVAGVTWLPRHQVRANYEFGVQQAAFAATIRRSLAAAIDFLVGLAALAALICWQFPNSGLKPKLCTLDALCNTLFMYERSVSQGMNAGFDVFKSVLARAFIMSLEIFNLPRHLDPSFVSLLLVEVCALFVLKCWVEGCYGITPGKWLLGIRTQRSTLRPCGFGRALVRNVLYWFDIPCFVTPLPAAISVTFSEDLQRLGDRIADTVVIRAGTIRDTDRCVDN